MYLCCQATVDDLRQEAQGECDKALHKLFEMEKLVYSQDKTYTTELGKFVLKGHVSIILF